MQTEIVPIDEPTPDPANARKHGERNLQAIIDSLKAFGQQKPIVLDPRGIVVAGNGTLEAARRLGWEEIAIVRSDLDPTQATAFGIADNRTAELAEWDGEVLRSLVDSLDDDLAGILAFEDDELDAMVDGLPGGSAGSPGDEVPRPSLHDRFGVPPFSVLDQRQGYWQQRRRRWLSMGISSEVGRKGNLLGAAYGRNDPQFYNKKTAAEQRLGKVLTYQEFLDDHYTPSDKPCHSGTSIFDPVLVEILVRWFSAPGSAVLDPFAGGSVRGIVTATLGRDYTGVDLAGDQVEENRRQWQAVLERESDRPDPTELIPDSKPGKTPIEKVQGREVWVKRDDLFAVAGVQGGKVRSCWSLSQGAKGLVTAGSRSSPQANIVAHIAKRLGVPARVHTPEGLLSPELRSAQAAGAEVIQHRAGYNNVIIARAREDAEARGWTEIPFGMECYEAVEQTKAQVPATLPPGVERLVVPVGSGMSLAGILMGLEEQGIEVPILGVVVGADPRDRLEEYAPPGWEDKVDLVDSGLDYHASAGETRLGEIELDPHYEAKCLPFLADGDLLWIVGIRQTALHPDLAASSTPVASATWIEGDSRDIRDLVRTDLEYDFMLSCPPYADLEKYSDDPADLSTLDYDEFLEAYREIIASAADLLAMDSFAAFVVGEVRGKDGNFYSFVPDTIRAFEDAGLRYYNEAILVNCPGSAAVRAARYLEASRKLTKVHQNVLVFLKGDAKRAAARAGILEIDESYLADLDDEAGDVE